MYSSFFSTLSFSDKVMKEIGKKPCARITHLPLHAETILATCSSPPPPPATLCRLLGSMGKQNALVNKELPIFTKSEDRKKKKTNPMLETKFSHASMSFILSNKIQKVLVNRDLRFKKKCKKKKKSQVKLTFPYLKNHQPL